MNNDRSRTALAKWAAARWQAIMRICRLAVRRGVVNGGTSASASPREVDQKFRILWSPALLKQDMDQALGPSGCALLYLDLDNFKALNERFLESVIDAHLLPELHRLIHVACGRRAYAYKEGGDEITVLVPDCSTEEAGRFAEGLLRAVNEASFSINGEPIRLSVSIGVATAESREELAGLLERANIAKREAKATGRNRVVLDASSPHHRDALSLSTIAVAERGRFVVALTHLHNDESGSAEQLLAECLVECEGIELLRVDRKLLPRGAPTHALVRAATDDAAALLSSARATVLVWGTVLHSADRIVPKLYLTYRGTVGIANVIGRYPLQPEVLTLPVVFWNDLRHVLQLVVTTLHAEHQAMEGIYLADRLSSFMSSARALLEGERRLLRWSHVERVTLCIALSNAMRVFGEQRADSEALAEAIRVAQSAVDSSAAVRDDLVAIRSLLCLGAALRSSGVREGVATELESAAAVYRRVLTLPMVRHRSPTWGTAQHELGVTLRLLGERAPEAGRLEEAIAAFGAALSVRVRAEAPREWAASMVGLGDALVRLGERRPDTSRLGDAIAAYSAVLAEHRREVVPLKWAAAQFGLGRAMLAQAESESGPERLRQAVRAFSESLGERTREHVPLDWAQSQMSLANASRILAMRLGDWTILQQAVEAYRAALTVLSRECDPLLWAAGNNNLGTSLYLLGANDANVDYLREAVECFRRALTECTRERNALDWAMTQNNLGTALWALAERAPGSELLEEAMDALDEALQEQTRERTPLKWARTQANKAVAQSMLGERLGDIALLREACVSFRLALLECPRERVPEEAAAIANGLGNALRSIGSLSSDASAIDEAIEVFRQALDDQRGLEPATVATLYNNLGQTYSLLAHVSGDGACLDLAVASLEDALERRSPDHEATRWAGSQRALGDALAARARRDRSAASASAALRAHLAALRILGSTHDPSSSTLQDSIAEDKKLLRCFGGDTALDVGDLPPS